MTCSQAATRHCGRAPDACVRPGLLSVDGARAPDGERLVGHAAVLGRPLRARGIEWSGLRTLLVSRTAELKNYGTVQCSGCCVQTRHAFGPHVCGDAADIDPTSEQVLTGSWRRDKTLQVLSDASGTLVLLVSGFLFSLNTGTLNNVHRHASTLYSCGTSLAEINCATFRRIICIARWCALFWVWRHCSAFYTMSPGLSV